MKNELFKDLREDEKSRLTAAIWNFSSAFTSSQEYKDYEKTLSRMNQDVEAQKQLQVYQKKQQEVNGNYRRDGNREKALAEMKSLQDTLMQNGAISAYTFAQEAMMDLCTEAGDMLSKKIGLDYASVCAPSCCG
jgi:cell fate (sporulation/competence/biofilm development) regulator YlbF (YheA/YmcA/DUF963 family)